MHNLTTEKCGDIEQLKGLFSLELVGMASGLSHGSVPVHSSSAEPLNEHPIWGHPQQNPLLQVTEKPVHCVRQLLRQRQGGRRREADLLDAAGPVDMFVGDEGCALRDETPLWACGRYFGYSLSTVQYLHLHPKVWEQKKSAACFFLNIFKN